MLFKSKRGRYMIILLQILANDQPMSTLRIRSGAGAPRFASPRPAASMCQLHICFLALICISMLNYAAESNNSTSLVRSSSKPLNLATKIPSEASNGKTKPCPSKNLENLILNFASLLAELKQNSSNKSSSIQQHDRQNNAKPATLNQQRQHHLNPTYRYLLNCVTKSSLSPPSEAINRNESESSSSTSRHQQEQNERHFRENGTIPIPIKAQERFKTDDVGTVSTAAGESHDDNDKYLDDSFENSQRAPSDMSLIGSGRLFSPTNSKVDHDDDDKQLLEMKQQQTTMVENNQFVPSSDVADVIVNGVVGIGTRRIDPNSTTDPADMQQRPRRAEISTRTSLGAVVSLQFREDLYGDFFVTILFTGPSNVLQLVSRNASFELVSKGEIEGEEEEEGEDQLKKFNFNCTLSAKVNRPQCHFMNMRTSGNQSSGKEAHYHAFDSDERGSFILHFVLLRDEASLLDARRRIKREIKPFSRAALELLLIACKLERNHLKNGHKLTDDSGGDDDNVLKVSFPLNYLEQRTFNISLDHDDCDDESNEYKASSFMLIMLALDNGMAHFRLSNKTIEEGCLRALNDNHHHRRDQVGRNVGFSCGRCFCCCLQELFISREPSPSALKRTGRRVAVEGVIERVRRELETKFNHLDHSDKLIACLFNLVGEPVNFSTRDRISFERQPQGRPKPQRARLNYYGKKLDGRSSIRKVNRISGLKLSEILSDELAANHVEGFRFSKKLLVSKIIRDLIEAACRRRRRRRFHCQFTSEAASIESTRLKRDNFSRLKKKNQDRLLLNHEGIGAGRLQQFKAITPTEENDILVRKVRSSDAKLKLERISLLARQKEKKAKQKEQEQEKEINFLTTNIVGSSDNRIHTGRGNIIDRLYNTSSNDPRIVCSEKEAERGIDELRIARKNESKTTGRNVSLDDNHRSKILFGANFSEPQEPSKTTKVLSYHKKSLFVKLRRRRRNNSDHNHHHLRARHRSYEKSQKKSRSRNFPEKPSFIIDDQAKIEQRIGSTSWSQSKSKTDSESESEFEHSSSSLLHKRSNRADEDEQEEGEPKRLSNNSDYNKSRSQVKSRFVPSSRTGGYIATAANRIRSGSGSGRRITEWEPSNDDHRRWNNKNSSHHRHQNNLPFARSKNRQARQATTITTTTNQTVQSGSQPLQVTQPTTETSQKNKPNNDEPQAKTTILGHHSIGTNEELIELLALFHVRTEELQDQIDRFLANRLTLGPTRNQNLTTNKVVAEPAKQNEVQVLNSWSPSTSKSSESNSEESSSSSSSLSAQSFDRFNKNELENTKKVSFSPTHPLPLPFPASTPTLDIVSSQLHNKDTPNSFLTSTATTTSKQQETNSSQTSKIELTSKTRIQTSEQHKQPTNVAKNTNDTDDITASKTGSRNSTEAIQATERKKFSPQNNHHTLSSSSSATISQFFARQRPAIYQRIKMHFGADDESLLKWLRSKQEQYSTLKNITIDLISETPKRAINVCPDGPKIWIYRRLDGNRTLNDIFYCYTHDQWIEKLWLDWRPSPYHYPLLALNILIFLFGATGNIFVCLSVYRNHQLRNVTNYHIVNLAIADLLVIIICLPATSIWDVSLTWFFGTIPCKLIMYLQDVSISVSVLTLAAISIDRYYAICYPLRFKSSLSKAKRVICLIWLLSLTIMVPDLIYLSATQSLELSEAGLNTVLYSDCNYTWSEQSSRLFQYVKTILLYFVPFVFMFVAHFRIMRTLSKSTTTTSNHNNSTKSDQIKRFHHRPSEIVAGNGSRSDERKPLALSIENKSVGRLAAPLSTTSVEVPNVQKPKLILVAEQWSPNQQNHENNSKQGEEKQHDMATMSGGRLQMRRATVHSGSISFLAPAPLATFESHPVAKFSSTEAATAAAAAALKSSSMSMSDKKDQSADLTKRQANGQQQYQQEHIEPTESGLDAQNNNSNQAAPTAPANRSNLISSRSGTTVDIYISENSTTVVDATGQSARSDINTSDIERDIGSKPAATMTPAEQDKRIASARGEHLNKSSGESQLIDGALHSGKLPSTTISGHVVHEPATNLSAVDLSSPLPDSNTNTNTSTRTNPSGFGPNLLSKRKSLIATTGNTTSDLQKITSSNLHRNSSFCVSMHNKSQLESRRNAAKMLMAIVIFFGVSHLPVHLMNFLRHFIEDLPQNDFTLTMSMVAHSLCHLTSAINPIIYNYMNSVFRAEFKRSLACLLHPCSSGGRANPSSTSTNKTHHSSISRRPKADQAGLQENRQHQYQYNRRIISNLSMLQSFIKPDCNL